jgi:hypothetical protein
MGLRKLSFWGLLLEIWRNNLDSHLEDYKEGSWYQTCLRFGRKNLDPSGSTKALV